MDDLVIWLRTQLDADAAGAADPYAEKSWHAKGCESLPDVLYPERETGACDCGVPSRLLREIDAKRQLVNAHSRPHECVALTGSGEKSVVDGQPWELWELEHTSDDGPCTTLCVLALPYADRDGYLPEWRP
ncbi:DUF6221 family protein [Streptomyces sp. NPDC004610]|uniref:DUF6221 family protein n=1 Tax=unclassified Streptomyces TaxID=2593676 RepID=UPI0033A9B52A